MFNTKYILEHKCLDDLLGGWAIVEGKLVFIVRVKEGAIPQQGTKLTFNFRGLILSSKAIGS